MQAAHCFPDNQAEKHSPGTCPATAVTADIVDCPAIADTSASAADFAARDTARHSSGLAVANSEVPARNAAAQNAEHYYAAARAPTPEADK